MLTNSACAIDSDKSCLLIQPAVNQCPPSRGKQDCAKLPSASKFLNLHYRRYQTENTVLSQHRRRAFFSGTYRNIPTFKLVREQRLTDVRVNPAWTVLLPPVKFIVCTRRLIFSLNFKAKTTTWSPIILPIRKHYNTNFQTYFIPNWSTMEISHRICQRNGRTWGCKINHFRNCFVWP